MIPMVLPDDTSTGRTPHRQTALAGILPPGFTLELGLGFWKLMHLWAACLGIGCCLRMMRWLV